MRLIILIHINVLINISIQQVYVVFMLYFAVSERFHVSSTTCDHCQTCHQTILLACQLKIIRVVVQPQHNN